MQKYTGETQRAVEYKSKLICCNTNGTTMMWFWSTSSPSAGVCSNGDSQYQQIEYNILEMILMMQFNVLRGPVTCLYIKQLALTVSQFGGCIL